MKSLSRSKTKLGHKSKRSGDEDENPSFSSRKRSRTRSRSRSRNPTGSTISERKTHGISLISAEVRNEDDDRSFSNQRVSK